jgi:hypothetical protein
MDILSKIITLFVSFAVFLNSCGGGKQFAVEDMEKKQGVKIYYIDGNSDEGVIKEIKSEKIVFVSERDHEPQEIDPQEIRRVEKLNKTYDDLAYTISQAEINKYKNSHNTWGYAIGGVIIGAAAGLALGLPFWYAEIDALPPYFWAGAGAITGSIFFAIRGQEKDKEIAVEKIRFIRNTERELQEEIKKEKQQLEDLEKEKKRLQEKLKSQSETQ